MSRYYRKPSDTRRCWDCEATVTLPGVDNMAKVDRVARRLGWKYLEWRGRMLCPDCWPKRKAAGYALDFEDLPF